MTPAAGGGAPGSPGQLVEIRILGAITVRLAGKRIRLGDAKHRLMLAMLVAAEGRLVSTELLIDQIWGERSPRTARGLIHSYASDLRGRLESGLAGAGEMLPRHHDGGYQFLADGASVDLYQFRDLFRRGKAVAERDDRQAASLLRQALSLWDTGSQQGDPGGIPLADLNTASTGDCQWLKDYRQFLREQHRAALIACLEAELRLGEHERLTAELADLAATSPLDERIAGLLMIAYYRSGRQAEVTAVYQRIRDTLRSELGAEPGQQLRELHQKILNHDPTLNIPGSAHEELAFARAAVPARQIVADITDFSVLINEHTEEFVGRRRFRERLWDIFDDDAFTAGYLIVHGEPGIGKTALLAKLVRERNLVHHFNSVLVGVTSREQFLRSVCAQLIITYDLPGKRLSAEATADTGMLLDLLSRAAGRSGRVLVAIDAIDEAVAAENAGNRLFLPPALPPGVFFVVTMRDPDDVELYVDEPRHLPLLEADVENQADIREYIAAFLGRYRQKMNQRLGELGIEATELSEKLADRSEGNFMYLRHVLRGIRDNTFGGLDPDGVDELPRGLRAYYLHLEKQLLRRTGDDPEKELAILGVLAAWPSPLTRQRLARFAGENATLTSAVLQRWSPFLNKVRTGQEASYALYHASFRDHLSERLDMNTVRERIDEAIEAELS
jgi:DNA-binding SARP family transcriptional activator